MIRKIIILNIFLLFTSTAFSSIVVTNGLTHRHSLAPAGADEGLVVIKNISKKAERVVIYLMDLPVGCDGNDFALSKPGVNPRSLTSWISLESEERTLAPGEEYPMKYQMQVPDTKLSGSYWGLIMVEVKSPIDTSRQKYTIQINSNVRYAIQIIADLPTGENDKVLVEFEDVKLQREEKEISVQLQLKNQSSKLLVPDIKLEIYDSEGELIFEEKAERKKLYPLQCKKYNIPLDKLSDGEYEAVLVADCGEADLFGMTLSINLLE